MDSNSLIYFMASYLIFIAGAYAAIHVLVTKDARHYVRHIVSILGSAFLGYYTALVMKQILALPRPDLTNALLIPNDIFGFPSGHATFMFALACSMYSFDKKAGMILFVMAILVGVGRVLAGVHYWYDIVGGMILGSIVSYIVLRIAKRIHG